MRAKRRRSRAAKRRRFSKGAAWAGAGVAVAVALVLAVLAFGGPGDRGALTGLGGLGSLASSVAGGDGGFQPVGNARLDTALAGYTLGRPAVEGKLAVVPIIAPAGTSEGGNYLTLEEAMDRQLLTVTEVEGGGSVPVLMVNSKATDRVLVPFGAVITGGNQDRMVGAETVLLPGESRRIPVYCVEQGRWHENDDEVVTIAAYAGGTAPMAGAANPGPARFVYSKTLASNDLKAIASDSEGSQQEIWADVSDKNAKLANESETANFQGNLETPAVQETTSRLEPVRKSIESTPRVAGVIAVMGGKVTGCELYAGPAYFKKLWPQILGAYAVDSAASEDDAEADAAKARSAATAWLAKLTKAKLTQKVEKSGVKIRIDAGDAVGGAIVEPAGGRLVYLKLFPRATGETGARAENPVFVHERVVVSEEFETENDADLGDAGQEDEITDIPIRRVGTRESTLQEDD